VEYHGIGGGDVVPVLGFANMFARLAKQGAFDARRIGCFLDYLMRRAIF